MAPLQLLSALGPTASRPHPTARSAGLPQTRPDLPGRLLQQTLPSGSGALVPEEEAFAPTRTPASRESSAATAPGGRQSVVTQAPAEEMRVLAAEIGARRRRALLALLGVAVVLAVGSIAFLAGRTESGSDVGPVAPPGAAPIPPALPVPPPPTLGARAPTPPPRPEEPATPPAAPGFLVVKAQPWGKLFVDGKAFGDVEGSRRVTLAPGSHTVRLVNGKKVRPWTVEIESGKTVSREHSFLEE
jgi:hypothetical protein